MMNLGREGGVGWGVGESWGGEWQAQRAWVMGVLLQVKVPAKERYGAGAAGEGSRDLTIGSGHYRVWGALARGGACCVGWGMDAWGVWVGGGRRVGKEEWGRARRAMGMLLPVEVAGCTRGRGCKQGPHSTWV